MPRAVVTTILAIVAVCALNTGRAWAHPAWGIVVDRSNQIYFSDLETVWKIDAQGKLTVFRTGVSGRHIHELASDEDGNLYGGELSYEPGTGRYLNALWKMTPGGVFAYTLAPTYTPPKGMSIWRDRDGSMYSALWKSNSEHELLLLKRTPDGKVTTLFGNKETANEFRQVVLYSVGGMTFGADGSLYVADGPNIRKVAMNGAVTTLARNLAPDNSSDSPAGKKAVTRLLGIAVDAEGSVFVADNDNRRVLKITSDGKVTTLVRAEQPWSPAGVAFRDGTLYILENGFTPPRTSNGMRVRKLSPDGKITVLATNVGDENAAASANAVSEKTGPAVETETKVPYTLIGVILCIFALTIIVWRFRKKVVYPSA
jgi:sugar lactone lactonase YvrE